MLFSAICRCSRTWVQCALCAMNLRDTSLGETTLRTSHNPGAACSSHLPFLISVHPSSPTSNTESHFLPFLLLLLHLFRFSANSPPSAWASVGEARKQDGAAGKKKSFFQLYLCLLPSLSQLTAPPPHPCPFRISLHGPFHRPTSFIF